MSPKKIVYLLPPEDEDSFSREATKPIARNLAHGVVERSDGRFAVELISVASQPGRATLAPGLTVRQLAASGHPRDPRDAVSWETPEAIADADLVHLFEASSRGAEVGLLVAKQQRKPVCISDLGPATSPLFRQLGLLDLVDRVIACSDFSAALCQTSAPLTVVKGGVDSSRFTPSEPAFRRDRMLYAGPLSPGYGVDRLIEALPVGVPLTVCGPCRHEDYFALLQSLAAGKTVEFVTLADDVVTLNLYRRAWATVVPTVDLDCHGHPHPVIGRPSMALLESMACGTPVLATRLGSFPEFIDEGETGFLFAERSELTDRLNALASEPGLADSMGRKARLAVERDWDYRVAGEALRDAYEGLIGVASVTERAA